MGIDLGSTAKIFLPVGSISVRFLYGDPDGPLLILLPSRHPIKPFSSEPPQLPLPNI